MTDLARVEANAVNGDEAASAMIQRGIRVASRARTVVARARMRPRFTTSLHDWSNRAAMTDALIIAGSPA